MKSTSQAAIILFLVMVIIVLASLFWFLYSDYDATRQQADLANSRATRAAAMEAEAGQLRVEADQILTTRDALEMALATAVYIQNTQEQESINDQQTIQALETRIAERTPNDTVPEVTIIAPQDGSTFNLTQSVELVVAAIDPNGINTVRIIFDNNPPLEVPTGGETSVIIQEPWPLSEAGEHTAVITAVNSNNVSSQAATITIITENKLTSEQIAEEVANIMDPLPPQTPSTDELQIATESSSFRTNITPIILQAFDFATPQDIENTLAWGVYCEAASSQTSAALELEDDSPAMEMAMVQAAIRKWQESQYQFSQLLAAAPHDDTRAALCALAAGHEHWVMSEYVKRAPEARQTALADYLSPLTAVDTTNILTAQQTFGPTYGPGFFTAITASSDTTAVLDAWNTPPQSTAQILNPNEYQVNNEPTAVGLPDLTSYLGDDWNPMLKNVLGAFMLQKYLENYGELTEVETAVSGWQGDQYAIYQRDVDDALLLTLEINWTSAQDAQEFTSAYEGYVNGRFSGLATPIKSPENSRCWMDNTEETFCLFTEGTRTIIVRAPDDNLAVDTLEEIVEP